MSAAFEVVSAATSRPLTDFAVNLRLAHGDGTSGCAALTVINAHDRIQENLVSALSTNNQCAVTQVRKTRKYVSAVSDVLTIAAPAVLAYSILSASTFPAPSTNRVEIDAGQKKVSDSLLQGYEKYSRPDWDGYGAEPITLQTLRYAKKVLAVIPNTFGPADIAPSGDGFIGLEWVSDESPRYKIYFDIGPGEEWRAYWKFGVSDCGKMRGSSFGPETEKKLRDLFSELSILNGVRR